MLCMFLALLPLIESSALYAPPPTLPLADALADARILEPVGGGRSGPHRSGAD
jgi:hypothetical protein